MARRKGVCGQTAAPHGPAPPSPLAPPLLPAVIPPLESSTTLPNTKHIRTNYKFQDTLQKAVGAAKLFYDAQAERAPGLDTPQSPTSFTPLPDRCRLGPCTPLLCSPPSSGPIGSGVDPDELRQRLVSIVTGFETSAPTCLISPCNAPFNASSSEILSLLSSLSSSAASSGYSSPEVPLAHAAFAQSTSSVKRKAHCCKHPSRLSKKQRADALSGRSSPDIPLAHTVPPTTTSLPGFKPKAHRGKYRLSKKKKKKRAMTEPDGRILPPAVGLKRGPCGRAYPIEYVVLSDAWQGPKVKKGFGSARRWRAKEAHKRLCRGPWSKQHSVLYEKPRPFLIIAVDADAEIKYSVERSGYTGSCRRPTGELGEDKRPPSLEELETQGFFHFKWDTLLTHLVLDDEERIIMVLIGEPTEVDGRPAEKHWQALCQRLAAKLTGVASMRSYHLDPRMAVVKRSHKRFA
ncbi:hypothetical protein K488DRAFT_91725 [Vararia minispora EC-137]|uniref:Uncharacterized protein n=1 Tax=Vararia minispora EC-137 TaxID=1314806 RepID=A0ACB8Q5G9_9AGAM|nr:hypothetical protein K488DRAFT_91725 [Vararia minispora EC-137]